MNSLDFERWDENTKDEDWLRKRQSKSTTVPIWVTSVDDINYIPKEKSFKL